MIQGREADEGGGIKRLQGWMWEKGRKEGEREVDTKSDKITTEITETISDRC